MDILIYKRSVVTGGQANHAMVKVNGVLLDPRTGMVQDYRIAYIYDFDEIFYWPFLEGMILWIDGK